MGAVGALPKSCCLPTQRPFQQHFTSDVVCHGYQHVSWFLRWPRKFKISASSHLNLAVGMASKFFTRTWVAMVALANMSALHISKLQIIVHSKHGERESGTFKEIKGMVRSIWAAQQWGRHSGLITRNVGPLCPSIFRLDSSAVTTFLRYPSHWWHHLWF